MTYEVAVTDGNRKGTVECRTETEQAALREALRTYTGQISRYSFGAVTVVHNESRYTVEGIVKADSCGDLYVDRIGDKGKFLAGGITVTVRR